MSVRRIIHLIPALRIGGAETMVLNYLRSSACERRYMVVVFRGADPEILRSLPPARRRHIFILGGRSSLSRTWQLLALLRKNRSSVVVSSMWPSALALMLASTVFRFRRHVSFTHRSSSAHLLDYVVRRWQVRNSAVRLADSEKSAEWVRLQVGAAEVVTMPAVFQVGHVSGPRSLCNPARLCFVGRIAPVKNLSAVLRLFALLKELRSDVTLDIYGPDGGDLEMVRLLVEREGLQEVVQYRGVLAPQDVQKVIREYDFLLLLSHTEGMALSVVEAMQVGVVPVVGRVGGPGQYCRNDNNAVVVDEYSDEGLLVAATRVARLISDPAEYRRLSEGASVTFQDMPFFETRFNLALSEASEIR